MTRCAAFLRNVPVLAGLSPELIERVAARVDEVAVGAGEWISREGESAESMFIVRGGRVEVVDEGPPEVLLRTLRRGDVVGELALLGSGRRAASARASRGTELLELRRTDFEALIEEAPGFALGLTRAMAAQIAASRAPVVATAPPRTIAVVALDQGVPIDDVAVRLADALGTHGSVALLREGGLAAIDRAERDAERVVLAGATGGWRELYIREADVVIAATSGLPDAEWLDEPTGLRGCELLAIGPAVSEGVLARVQPRQVQVVPQPRLGLALAQTGRRLAGRSLGIVLSGGGARALAHLGVLQELRAWGLVFDRVAGASLGALIGAATAAGFSDESMYAMAKQTFVDGRPSSDFVPPAYSLIRGAKARRHIHETFGERRIEQLPSRFSCVSCDLIAREQVVHTTGLIGDAVYASLAIPGVFPPVATGGRLLVDGGVLDNLPVGAMGRAGEGPIVAVDVTGRPTGFRAGRRSTAARSVRRALTGSEAEIPRLGETLVRSVMVGSSDTVAAAQMHADLVIMPQVDGIGLMDWKALPRAVELGRRAAREALSADSTLIDRLGR